MRFRTSMMVASLSLLVASISFARQPQLPEPNLGGPALLGPTNFQDPTPIPGIGAPVPDPGLSGPALSAPTGAIVAPPVDAAPMLLSDCNCTFYDKVCVKNKKRIAPCAEVMVVSVVDPCSRKYDCETRCVQVKICVPTCGCPKVKISRNGRHTRYDYGKYAIDIFSNRNGTILIDYDA